jgi:phosphoserine phosphatase RsbX
VRALWVKSAHSVRSAEGFGSSGDAAAAFRESGSQLFCVVDALGHGPDAQKSADVAMATVRANCGRSLQEIFAACDRALVGLRGAVMSLIQQRDEGASFAGVGNVELFGPKGVSRPACVPGVLGRGFNIKQLRESRLPAETGHRWALASDGLRAREVPRALEHAAGLPPVQAAASLIELAGRTDDDASVLVMDFVEPIHQQSLTVRGRPDAVGAGLQVKAMAGGCGWDLREAEELSLLVIELCVNAARHGGGGVCHVTLDSDYAELVVEDQGPGLPAWVLERHADGRGIEDAPERSLEGGAQALRARENSGLGAGLDVARRLAKRLSLENLSPRGSRVFASRGRRLF